jgi:uncharacterized membrane protein YccC
MLALYLASAAGLPRPFWAMMTAYVVANPLAGAVRSKALYRVLGTIGGSAATVLLVPPLANAPELLSLALACWVGLCLYISLLDRTPRSYLFMLAGYTAGLIGFPAVTDPASVFDLALARVEEISIGIVSASVVHSLLFPQSLGPVLLARLDRAIGDARHWVRDTVAAAGAAQSTRARRTTLAAEISEMRVMSTHLPFDTSHLRWTSDMIHALSDRLTVMVPLLLAVEDRLLALREEDPACLDAPWHAVLDDIAQWVGDGNRADPARAVQLRAALATLAPALGPDASWSDILRLNLSERLRALVDACQQGLALRAQIDAVLHGGAPVALDSQPPQLPAVLHRDHGMALRSAFAAVIAILASCAFWIVTGWPAGAAMPMMAGVFCCFFAAQDDPVPSIRMFLNYTLLSVPISAFYLLVVMPSVHTFETFALASAPLLLVLGVLIARPATGLQAMALLFGIAGMFGLADTGTLDLLSFTNGMLAQLAGYGAAVLCTGLLRSVSAGWTARRLLLAGRKELARMTEAARTPSLMAVSARMLDRIGLLTPRLAMTDPTQDVSAVDALRDLRIGLNIAQLRQLQPALEQGGVSSRLLMQRLSAHFRRQGAGGLAAEPALLDCLDTMLRAVCAYAGGTERQQGASALASLRRDLFPAAIAYHPTSHLHKEPQ